MGNFTGLITTLIEVTTLSDPHPELVPFLIKHELDWSTFHKKGRPPEGVREKRSAIVTELHRKGMSWARMMEVTGLSNGSIQRLSQAMWNQATRVRTKEVGRKLGQSWKGKKRPGQLEAQWKAGTFDFHRGRVRSEEERARLRASWTPERRRMAASHSLKLWRNPTIRKQLLAFHRSPEERARRSQAQSRRMLETPSKFLRGRAQWADTPKGKKDRAYVRSTYEAAAVRILEGDPKVLSYEHERRLVLGDGRWILPDFVVSFSNGQEVLIEVKARWVFALPVGHQVRRRLKVAQDLAQHRGWGFEVWTEEVLGDALKHAA